MIKSNYDALICITEFDKIITIYFKHLYTCACHAKYSKSILSKNNDNVSLLINVTECFSLFLLTLL